MINILVHHPILVTCIILAVCFLQAPGISVLGAPRSSDSVVLGSLVHGCGSMVSLADRASRQG
jgi:hypothetical protein